MHRLARHLGMLLLTSPTPQGCCLIVGSLLGTRPLQVYYCSEECAKLAWKAGHKQECKALRAAAAA